MKNFLIKTPSFFQQESESTHSKTMVNVVLTDTFCAYYQQRGEGGKLIDTSIGLDTVTDFHRKMIHFIETIFFTKDSHEKFDIDYYLDFYLMGPNRLPVLTRLVCDMFDCYQHSDAFQTPSDEYLYFFTKTRQALLELISNVYAAVWEEQAASHACVLRELDSLREEAKLRLAGTSETVNDISKLTDF
jgi:hypothetical protein